MTIHDVENTVRLRYAEGARAQQPELCCPVDYDPKYLEIIPDEVIERDYGCGDPSRYLNAGETVLDLGSGTGKICFIAAQVVGPTGKVIGVDMTTDMLDVARRNAPVVAERLGYANVEFRRGRIQDLGLDLDRLEELLAARPIANVDGLFEVEGLADTLRANEPLVTDDSVDVVVSNCVLNLVQPNLKPKLFREIYRVLRRGGRAVISDIVSDEDVPLELQRDPDLWSGCISGALTEHGFLQAFEAAGFHGIRILSRQEEPWQTVRGLEFRSLTIEAFKGKEGDCWERNQAVVYRGPFREVLDDDGHRMRRGHRYAVCDKTYQLYRQEPYRDSFEYIEPRTPIPLAEAQPFDCSGIRLRAASETKGDGYHETILSDEAVCGPDGCC